MMKQLTIGCVTALLFGLAAPTRADLVVYVHDTTVTQGGYGLLNVYVGGTTPNAFDTYNLTLSITPIGGAAGTVIFAPNDVAPDPSNIANGTQPYSYLYPSGSTATNYIFANDSLDSVAGVNGGAYVLGQPSTYFAATDSSLSGSEYAPNATSDSPTSPIPPTTLLTSLLIQAVSTNVLEQYQVNVLLDPASTAFINNGTAVGPVSDDTSVTGYTGTVTIAATSVPEPASVIAGVMGLMTVVCVSSRRSRRPIQLV